MKSNRKPAPGLILTTLLGLGLALGAAAADKEVAKGNGTWRNTPAVDCSFPSGTRTVVGFLKTNCDPNYDRDCTLYIDTKAIKQDSARKYESRQTESCRLQLVDGPRNALRPLWRASKEGELVVRVTGLVTDGVLTVSRGKVISMGVD